MTCEHCGKEALDVASVTLPEGEFGMCSIACMVLWVQRRFMLGASAARP